MPATMPAAAPSSVPAAATTAMSQGLSAEGGRDHDRGQATFFDPKAPQHCAPPSLVCFTLQKPLLSTQHFSCQSLSATAGEQLWIKKSRNLAD
jgi:hypothetical protein